MIMLLSTFLSPLAGDTNRMETANASSVVLMFISQMSPLAGDTNRMETVQGDI